jgi:tRNA threonylcarbamoyladenosine biosynthesis protein TsaB
MRILAIDTTGAAGSIALYDRELIAEIPLHEPDGYGHVLFEYISRSLERHEWTIESVVCFAAASGPGSFTGVRIGLAAMKGLAEAVGASAIGVSNLQALAAFGTAGQRAVMLDARRGEIYAAVYTADLKPAGPEVVMSAPAWLSSLSPLPEEAISTDMSAYRTLLGPDVRCIEQRTIAAAVAQIAARRLASGDPGDPLAVDANYVRRSDAELFWQEK